MVHTLMDSFLYMSASIFSNLRRFGHKQVDLKYIQEFVTTDVINFKWVINIALFVSFRLVSVLHPKEPCLLSEILVLTYTIYQNPI